MQQAQGREPGAIALCKEQWLPPSDDNLHVVGAAHRDETL